MRRCGFLDIPCTVWTIIEPVWFWIQLGFWIAVAALALWALSRIKEIGGWPAVAAAVTTTAAGAAYVFGWRRGREGKGLNPTEHLPDGHIDSVTYRKPKVKVRTARRDPAKPVEPPKSIAGD